MQDTVSSTTSTHGGHNHPQWLCFSYFFQISILPSLLIDHLLHSLDFCHIILSYIKWWECNNDAVKLYGQDLVITISMHWMYCLLKCLRSWQSCYTSHRTPYLVIGALGWLSSPFCASIFLTYHINYSEVLQLLEICAKYFKHSTSATSTHDGYNEPTPSNKQLVL